MADGAAFEAAVGSALVQYDADEREPRQSQLSPYLLGMAKWLSHRRRSVGQRGHHLGACKVEL